MSRINIGVVSVTFRKLSPREIIDLSLKAGLDCIEWGGDVHVPHGDYKLAEQVGDMTRDAGLSVCSYGSYYRCIPEQDTSLPPETVIDTARALGTNHIRVWAGAKGSAAADDSYRTEVTMRAAKFSEEADKYGIRVSFEYHPVTLTDTPDSACRLLFDLKAGTNNIGTYWQPVKERSFEENLSELVRVKPYLTNVHVFNWTNTGERRPLSEGADTWKSYISETADAAARNNRNSCALLEFVKNDSPEAFIEDAKTLKALLQ